MEKAVQIIQVIDDSDGGLNEYYMKLGQHFASVREYNMAEQFYMQGNNHKQAIEMYNSAGMWEEAHQLASRYMDSSEVNIVFLRIESCTIITKIFFRLP